MASRPNEKEDLNWREQFAALKHLPPFFKLIWKTSPAAAVGNILLRIVKSLLPLAMLYVGKEIIDQIVLLTGSADMDKNYLWMLVGFEFALAVISELLSRSITLLDSILGDLFANKTSVQLIRHAATLDLYQFENPEFYDKLERARRQTTGRTVLMSMVLQQLQDTITIVSLAAGLVVYSPWLMLLLLVAVIPSFLGETHFNYSSYSLSRSWTPQRRELDYLRYIGASDTTAKEVKVFGLSSFLAERFETLAHQYFLANRKLSVKRAYWGSLLSTISTLAYYGAYVFIITQTIAAIISLGTLTFLAGSFQRMRNMLQAIMQRFSSIAQNALYLQDYFDFMAMRPQISESGKKLSFPQEVQEGFVFENVSFRYPDMEVYAIRKLSFHLRKGEKLALVGENGAGKTTLVKLLARLYEPTEGRILLDGKDLREYSLSELRANIGIIFQDYIRFNLKASENISIGQIAETGNLLSIEAAAQKSLADTVIEPLPEQYDQMLGRRFTGGVELSGGQWQKIALARAYMRDAELVILDEPTSALDARAEHEVFKRFSELIHGKMAVLISHRFSTVRMADRILFLENGKLLELGTHDELLAKDGKYAELFLLQAQGYV